MTNRLVGLGSLLLLGWALPVQGQDSPFKAPDGSKELKNLEYIVGGHERQKLDLYLPAKADGPLPVVVWVHGGSWKGGNKDLCPAWLVGKGYAVASINYRLSQHAKFPAQIEDCKSAVRWLRANAARYQLDRDRVCVWGASAGGHLVCLLGTAGEVKEWDCKEGAPGESSCVQLVIDWFGPTDLWQLSGGSSKADSPIALLLGGPVSENREKAIKANPITYVSEKTPPFLIMHGDQDPLVPLSQSELLAAALTRAGRDVTLVTIKGAKHGGAEFLAPDVRKQIEEFLDKKLKKQEK